MKKAIINIIRKATQIAATVKAAVIRVANAIKTKAIELIITPTRIKAVLAGNSGENFVESALKILIAVVIGALLLAGLYMLFGDVVMPTLTQKIKDLFNYAG